MKIATKLKLVGLFSAGAIAIIGSVLLYASQQVRQELAKNEAAGKILNAVTSVRYLALEYATHHEERVQVQWQLTRDSLSKLITSDTIFTSEEEKIIFDELRHAHQSVNTLFAELIANRQNADKGKALVIQELEARLSGQITNKMQSMVSAALRLSERSRAGVLHAREQAAGAVLAFGGTVVAVIAMTLFLMLRSVTRPLAKLREGTATVGAGNLDHRLSITTRDEIGDLARAFDAMTETLKMTTVSRNEIAHGNRVLQAEIVERKRVEENLHHLLQATQETVDILFSSLGNIMEAAGQVAIGSEQTATAVSQTAATMQEVKQTAKFSTEKAQQVSENAQRTVDTSLNGRRSVENSIEAIYRIQEHMTMVVDSIVRLSEQSLAIGDITATVNALSEQSNVLSVNAAIEAAKAGAHGTGFSVVAQQIKTLAGESKQATAKVRTILSDIQRATSVAVTAIENGSKAVEAGVKLSREVDESIQVLQNNIDEAAQAATEIAALALQQSVGMDQAALAMQSIEQASAQNVASTKQTESAVQNLHLLGQKLKTLLGQYQTS